MRPNVRSRLNRTTLTKNQAKPFANVQAREYGIALNTAQAARSSAYSTSATPFDFAARILLLISLP
jgi:hypothetical protein